MGDTNKYSGIFATFLWELVRLALKGQDPMSLWEACGDFAHSPFVCVCERVYVSANMCG